MPEADVMPSLPEAMALVAGADEDKEVIIEHNYDQAPAVCPLMDCCRFVTSDSASCAQKRGFGCILVPAVLEAILKKSVEGCDS